MKNGLQKFWFEISVVARSECPTYFNAHEILFHHETR